MVKTVLRLIYPFRHINNLRVTDRRPDSHLSTPKTALTHSVARVKTAHIFDSCYSYPVMSQKKVDHLYFRVLRQRLTSSHIFSLFIVQKYLRRKQALIKTYTSPQF